MIPASENHSKIFIRFKTQFENNKPEREEKKGSRTWQFPLEQAEEREKKESRRRRRETDTTLLKPLVHADIAP